MAKKAKPEGQVTPAAKRKPAAKKAKPAAKKTAAPTDAPRIYTLDVWLLYPGTKRFALSNPSSAKRTIQIRGDQTLEQLSMAINAAFDRDDDHMYEFQMGKTPRDRRGLRYEMEMADRYGNETVGTVEETTIEEIGLRPRRLFGYLFDFGDSWEHQIRVEKIEDGPGEGVYPRVIKRVGESPPQYPGEEDEYEDEDEDEDKDKDEKSQV